MGSFIVEVRTPKRRLLICMENGPQPQTHTERKLVIIVDTLNAICSALKSYKDLSVPDRPIVVRKQITLGET